MNYGLPYMGSKNKIAEWVVSHFPSADNFYDLCCGGSAITHCAMEQRKFKNYHINDINATMVNGFIDCLNGRFKDEDRWIGHEEFDRLKGKGDLYVDLCFSFGNNWKKGYAYSRSIEPLKKAVHYAIFFDDYSLLNEFGIYCILSPDKSKKDRYLEFKRFIKNNKGEKFDLQCLESLERLHRLQSIQAQGNITSSSVSYDEIEIKSNSVIYCDIPYFQTAKYNGCNFDHEHFYNWCERQTEPLFISEYWMPEDRFVCIGEKQKRNILSSNNNSKISIEKIFIPKHQYKNVKKNLFD